MWFSSIWPIFTSLLYLLNIAVAVYSSIMLISSRRDPVKTLSWVMVMIMLPYIGIILYFFFGRNFRKDKMFSRKGARDLGLRKELCKEMLEKFEDRDNIPQAVRRHHKLVVQNIRSAYSLLSANDSVKIYFSGKEALTAMLEAMRGARTHIHLQSFIIEDDNVGNIFKDVLAAKAREGVEVRMMYDGFGGRHLGKKFLKELQDAGVEILNFSPFRLFFLPPIVNYRNHRKILVVDGHIGFLGGCNIADRYFDGGEFPEWRDTHVRIEGMSVMSLQATFLLDRYFILNKNLGRRRKYYPYVDTKDKEMLTTGTAGGSRYYAQILSSGPDSDWAAIMQCYFTAITKARDHICIITPYFIPSETILNAIKITALSDVKVSLMIPERSDTWLTNWGTMSYISELIDAGVKVYLFKRGFNHSKVLSIDGEYCIIGSANMDNRSLEHHFEVTSVIYDPECAKTIEDQFRKDLSRCTLVTKAKWHRRPRRNKFYESVARLVSPLL
ncbi:MAG TPA: cardiolipin synthase [Candidatus Coprenecus stercoravium]|uniref:Cardiolipin synthase n=1 Tax=Candidatus Coprenecus stercoravium TaxID=2840735 RepID=A0A9D2K9S2_9BACT|nr:cardiolipin synthase [Candidatus Coprenecus stercoravium]